MKKIFILLLISINLYSGALPVLDYKTQNIIYINFNKKPRISKEAVVKWAKKQDPVIGVDEPSVVLAIIQNKVAWYVMFSSMDVLIDSDSGKVFKIKLFNEYGNGNNTKLMKKRYKCVYREFRKKRLIYQIAKKCKLFMAASTKETPISEK